jgi:hypothetical protein
MLNSSGIRNILILAGLLALSNALPLSADLLGCYAAADNGSVTCCEASIGCATDTFCSDGYDYLDTNDCDLVYAD